MHNTKNRPIIVTGGSAYADIDVLACAIAYKELLTLLGFNAFAIITGPLNQTIPSSIRAWNLEIERQFSLDPLQCDFVLVDLSDPKHMEKFVLLENVVEVFDHHHGHEEFWKKRLFGKARIETIGACATLIWEQFKAHHKGRKISSQSANLLYTAIFANTLDFKSAVTTPRDIKAQEELLSHTKLPPDWKAQYYKEVLAAFEKDLFAKMEQDTKTVEFRGDVYSFGQLELWNAQHLLNEIKSQVLNSPQKWIVNLVSIEEGRSYLFTNFPPMQNVLADMTSAEPLQGFLVAPRLWLRKEFLKGFIILEKSDLTLR